MSDRTNKENGAVVITGGSRGIGAATVRKAVACGHRVCFTYADDKAAAENVIKSIGTDKNHVVAIQVDVSKTEDIKRLFDFAEQKFLSVAALVNNAGVTGKLGAFVQASPEQIARVLEVNALGTMLCTHEIVLRWVRAGKTGKIVNVSSAAATLGGSHEYVHYAASKAAIDAFTLGLGRELAAQKIQINGVAPGSTLTEIHARAGEPDRPKRVVARIPAGRLAEPEEIADAIMWLLSDSASYLYGTTVRVAGGL